MKPVHCAGIASELTHDASSTVMSHDRIEIRLVIVSMSAVEAEPERKPPGS